MAANLYRGEVEFTTPASGDIPGKTYILRFGVNAFIAVQKELNELKGVEHLRRLLLAALTNVESQKDLTIEDAGDIIDDIGIDEVNALIAKTKWGIHTDRAVAAQKAAEKAAAAEAAARTTAKEAVPSDPPSGVTPSKT
jgi:hypothetical protein